jgi:hypothetical protein
MGIFKTPDVPSVAARPQVAQAKAVSGREQVGEGLSRQKLLSAVGNQSLNRTGPLGIQDQTAVQRKTLLGQ